MSGTQTQAASPAALSTADAMREAHALREQGALADAAAVCEGVLQLEPAHADALHTLAILRYRQRRFDEAVTLFERVRSRVAADPRLLNNLANALRDGGRLEEALVRYGEGLALGSARSSALRSVDGALLVNRGIAFEELGRQDEADTDYEKAISIDPQDANAHTCVAFSRLRRGELADGFRRYEWRWKMPAFLGRHAALGLPRWTGTESLAGRRLLVSTEQGLGDSLQFARYLPLLEARGAKVTVAAASEAKSLFASSFPTMDVRIQSTEVPSVDLHCPLLSLPLAFGTTVATIPTAIPYLRVDDSTGRRWKERLSASFMPKAKRRVGLVWAGGMASERDSRAIRFAALAPLLGTKSAQFYGLQKTFRDEEVEPIRLAPNLIPLGAELADLADTAAVINELDLVISTDTSVAHLAGALGKPVWILLPWVADWRWFTGRSDSPWYASARLFRQRTRGDWSGVIGEVRRALSSRR